MMQQLRRVGRGVAAVGNVVMAEACADSPQSPPASNEWSEGVAMRMEIFGIKDAGVQASATCRSGARSERVDLSPRNPRVFDTKATLSLDLRRPPGDLEILLPELAIACRGLPPCPSRMPAFALCSHRENIVASSWECRTSWRSFLKRPGHSPVEGGVSPTKLTRKCDLW